MRLKERGGQASREEKGGRVGLQLEKIDEWNRKDRGKAWSHGHVNTGHSLRGWTGPRFDPSGTSDKSVENITNSLAVPTNTPGTSVDNTPRMDLQQLNFDLCVPLIGFCAGGACVTVCVNWLVQ